jgi:hypothetical protein
MDLNAIGRSHANQGCILYFLLHHFLQSFTPLVPKHKAGPPRLNDVFRVSKLNDVFRVSKLNYLFRVRKIISSI